MIDGAEQYELTLASDEHLMLSCSVTFIMDDLGEPADVIIAGKRMGKELAQYLINLSLGEEIRQSTPD
jgi:hypothetical protein